MDDLYRPGYQYRRAGVSCEDLSPEGSEMPSLFDALNDDTADLDRAA